MIPVMSEPIGFIGLGLMGKPMALNLRKHEFDVVVHSRSRGPVDALVAAGASAADSPAAVARQARLIITMLPDGPDVSAVLEGPGGILEAMQPGTIIVDSSTIAPATAILATALVVVPPQRVTHLRLQRLFDDQTRRQLHQL